MQPCWTSLRRIFASTLTLAAHTPVESPGRVPTAANEAQRGHACETACECPSSVGCPPIEAHMLYDRRVDVFTPLCPPCQAFLSTRPLAVGATATAESFRDLEKGDAGHRGLAWRVPNLTSRISARPVRGENRGKLLKPVTVNFRLTMCASPSAAARARSTPSPRDGPAARARPRAGGGGGCATRCASRTHRRAGDLHDRIRARTTVETRQHNDQCLTTYI